MCTTTPHKMLWFAMLTALVTLSTGENEVNTASSESSSPVGPLITDAPPPREAVTDIFAAPLASFKVPLPPGSDEETELMGLPLGKAENGTDSSSQPPFSNLWFNAGQSLGSAANSLTGWLNSRLGAQSTTTTTTTTTRPPEVIVRVQSQKGKRKPLISIEPNRSQQGNRISPVNTDEDDDEEDDDDVDDDDDYDNDGEEEQADDDETTPNRYSGDEDEEDDDEESNDDEELDEDEEEPEPIKKRKKFVKAPPKRYDRRGYNQEDNDDEYGEDYEDDDDFEDYRPSNPHSSRQQQQQSLFNRFRQLTQMPYSSSNKKQIANQPNKGYRPVRVIQNGQVLQLVGDRPSQQKIKRQRRPSANQPSYQLIPIQTSQMPGGGGSTGQQQKKRRVPKPDNANNIYIPLPQGTSDINKKPGQYITIPWSKLGITNNQQDYSQNGQQAAPVIVNIPQFQGPKRRRPSAQMPANVASNPQRKRLKRPLKNQNGQVISLLSEQNIRDIFRAPEIPPSRTPLKPGKLGKPLDVPVDDDSTSKPLAINPETEVVSMEDDDDDESQDEGQDPYIVVGEDDSNDTPMSRHASASSITHIGGMKPYVDVLNVGRIYLKPGREMRISRELLPQPARLPHATAINPEPIDEVDKDVIRSHEVTTETSSEASTNNSPSLFILGPEDASTPSNSVPPPQQY